MVMANLHIICGNCGRNDMLEYKVEPDGQDIDGELKPAVFITCKNCSTLHNLNNTVPESDNKPFVRTKPLTSTVMRKEK